MDTDLAKLGRFIADHFDLDQLRALCQELDVSYDQLVGDSCPARAFDLVTVARDRGQLSALLAAVAQARPEAFDPQSFEVRQQREQAGRRGLGWPTLLGGGVALAILAGFVFLLIRRPASVPSLSASPTSPPTRSPTVTMTLPLPSPSPTTATATPSVVPDTPTARPTASPSLTAVPTSEIQATITATPSSPLFPTATPSPMPSLTATPILSPLSLAWTYDAETRTLRLAPGDATLGRARLCTPLNAYQSAQIIYLVESVADGLGLPLPGQARVTHTYPDHLAGGSVLQTLEVRRHPVEGVKVSGEAVNFIGCDLLVSEELRALLGFPLTLSEFNDPSRFDHGWVTIEFLIVPENP